MSIFTTYLKVGASVAIRNDQAPPLHWRLRRNLSLHYGPDGVARVADIKARVGEKKGRAQKCISYMFTFNLFYNICISL